MISSVLYLAPVKLVEVMIDNLNSSITNIIVIGITLILLYVLSAVLGAVTDYCIDSFSFETSNIIRIKIFENILKLNKETYSKLLKGKAFGGLIEDTKIISESSIKPICMLMKSIVSFILGVLLVASISPIITIVLIIIGLIASLINKKMGKKYEEKVNDTRDSSDDIWNLLSEINRFFVEIKLNKREILFLSKAKKYSNSFCEMEKSEDKQNKKMYAIDTIVFMGTIAILYIITSILVFTGNMSMGGLVAIMMYNSILIDPLLEITKMIKEYIKTNVSIKRINKYMIYNDEEIHEYSRKHIRESISLQNINYFDDDKRVLNNININIKITSKPKIAIVGESGSGKTTLLSVLCGLINPTSGKVYVDGVLCSQLDEYSGAFSVLLQECNTYKTSLRDNLLLFTDDWDNNSILQYIDILGLNEVLYNEGADHSVLDTELVNISGGEEKRIGIISALAKEADIICIDEISNSLDNTTCEKVMEFLLENFRNKTLIVIEHRIELIKDFDIIVLMRNGEIIDVGTHKQLLAKSRYYKRLNSMKGM